MDIPTHSLDDVLRAVNSVLTEYELCRSCIQASLILTNVLQAAGYLRAYPLTVGVEVGNPAAVAWVLEHGTRPDLAASEEAYKQTGAVSRRISMGDPVTGTQWPGHLVVILPWHSRDRHAMLDLTIEQLNLPAREIVLKQLCIEVSDAFANGIEHHFEIVNQCLLSYLAHPDDRSYEDAGGGMRQAASVWLRQSPSCD